MASATERKPRIRLELLVDERWMEGYHELMTNHTAALWSISKLPENIEETRKIFYSRMPSDEKPWSRSWGIILLDEGADLSEKQVGNEKQDEKLVVNGEGKGKFIGALGHPEEAVIGYRILPEYWGKGYMTEALQIFLGTWFAMEVNSKNNKLSAGVDPENFASQRVLEKVGFVKGEYVKDACQKTTAGGEWSDIQTFDFFRGSEIK